MNPVLVVLMACLLLAFLLGGLLGAAGMCVLLARLDRALDATDDEGRAATDHQTDLAPGGLRRRVAERRN